ncbi:MAG: MBL fold metallo-hydrolase [Candidatus Poribacteria bacterium]|nr:MBL fold metallo-hydrolase [Candidatus Poribacteria bacterium]
MKFGEFELFIVSDGTFRLDGGAMFGTIPKPLWEKTNPADARNRILMGLNCLLIRMPRETILIDTGLGNVYDEKFAFLYDVDKSETELLRSLAAAGVGAADITKVILTHLHFDHCGGNCFPDANGELKPTFPNAAYYINQEELAYAKQPDPRSRASYLPYTWEPLEKRGQVVLTSGDEEIAPGVMVMLTPGHTQNHQSVMVRSGEQTACFLADLVPMPSHLKTHYVMGYDLFPATTMESKERVLKQAQAESWLLIFEHSPDVKAGYLSEGLKIAPVTL